VPTVPTVPTLPPPTTALTTSLASPTLTVGHARSRPPLARVLDDAVKHHAGWRHLVRFTTYDRWHHRLAAVGSYETGPYEVWLVSWLPGQRTPLHDHGGSSGGFAVVEGELTERSGAAGVEAGVRAAGRHVRPGSLRIFGAGYVHEVVNAGTVPAVSVHVYSPALRTMTRYAWSPQGPTPTGVERAGVDW
jgi:predicted metal-dependent enzyme (double-stranded beta helix superfamily)